MHSTVKKTHPFIRSTGKAYDMMSSVIADCPDLTPPIFWTMVKPRRQREDMVEIGYDSGRVVAKEQS